MLLKLLENTEINQVSLTGVRALVLLSLLIEKPRSFEEIKQAFITLKLMNSGDSTDIIRIDLNTLRNSGCEITRAGSKTNFKYKLLKHPFSFELNKDEVAILKRVYNKLKNSFDIKLLIKCEELFKKLADNVSDIEIKDELYGLSILKDINTDFLIELLDDCESKKTLTLMYKKPSENEAKEKIVLAQRVVMQNDSFYLYCYDFSRKESVTLNIKRIISIISRILGSNDDIQIKTTDVKFLLKNSCIIDIEENERIIEKLADTRVIEGKYYNDFIAIQRILSFGADCTVLEPLDFRAKIVEKLKNMRSIYNG